jgi:hypothetical protein
MRVEEVADELRLPSMRDRKWFIQGASAVSGEGLHEGLDWLKSTMSKKDESRI